MKFVDEQIVESILTNLETGKWDVEEILAEFNQSQMPFLQFINSENFKLLTEEEYDLMLFNLLVLFKASSHEGPLNLVEAEQIEKIDEKNWEVYNEIGNKNFAKVLDAYFEDYTQEDLLAFVEDSLSTEEEEKISQVGKEIIFITCKTFIDACINLS